MPHQKVNSLRELSKLKVGPVVQIQRAGGHFKARFRGNANFVFGASAAEAHQRLLKTPSCTLINSPKNAAVS